MWSERTKRQPSWRQEGSDLRSPYEEEYGWRAGVIVVAIGNAHSICLPTFGAGLSSYRLTAHCMKRGGSKKSVKRAAVAREQRVEEWGTERVVRRRSNGRPALLPYRI
jgi:hypothetical protein